MHIIPRTNITPAERRQLSDAARDANSPDSDVYAALRAVALSSASGLETILPPAEARALARKLDKELPACPSAPTPATPSPSPSPKTRTSPKASSGASSADS